MNTRICLEYFVHDCRLSTLLDSSRQVYFPALDFEFLTKPNLDLSLNTISGIRDSKSFIRVRKNKVP